MLGIKIGGDGTESTAVAGANGKQKGKRIRENSAISDPAPNLDVVFLLKSPHLNNIINPTASIMR